MRTPNVTRGKRGFLRGRFSLSSGVPLSRMLQGTIMATASAFVKNRFQALGQTRLVTIFKIKELRQKVFITILFLAIYRIGFHVPLPMINQVEMARNFRGDEAILTLISMFSLPTL